MLEAEQTASQAGIRCEGLTGTHGGIIGALSAIGLHRAGNDGRFLWLPGLRELQGNHPAGEIRKLGHVDRICSLDNTEVHSKSIVNIGEWARPILRDGKSILYVEKKNDEWHIIPKEHIKKFSN